MNDASQQRSRGRDGPVDLEVAPQLGLKPGQPACDVHAHAAADADYFGNLKRFERHDNMAAEPTRERGYPKGTRP